MITAVLVTVLLLPVAFVLLTNKKLKLRRKWKVLTISLNAIFDFFFRMSSDERLQAFRKIHKLFPRFLHVDVLNAKVLVVYDPEIAKR